MNLFEPLPLADPPARGAGTGLPIPGAISEKTSMLLIVDDDEAVRAFACVASRRLGYQVIEATNGREALQQLAAHPGKIDLVLTDINMPVMDGLQLVKTLKSSAVVPAIAVMSGRMDQVSRISLQSDGVSEFLSKPFGVSSLQQVLLRAGAARG